MKKIAAILAAAVVFVTLSACVNGQTDFYEDTAAVVQTV